MPRSAMDSGNSGQGKGRGGEGRGGATAHRGEKRECQGRGFLRVLGT